MARFDIEDRASVIKAVEEYDHLGRKTFLG
jgi:hypothetical protein